MHSSPFQESLPLFFFLHWFVIKELQTTNKCTIWLITFLGARTICSFFGRTRGALSKWAWLNQKKHLSSLICNSDLALLKGRFSSELIRVSCYLPQGLLVWILVKSCKQMAARAQLWGAQIRSCRRGSGWKGCECVCVCCWGGYDHCAKLAAVWWISHTSSHLSLHPSVIDKELFLRACHVESPFSHSYHFPLSHDMHGCSHLVLV